MTAWMDLIANMGRSCSFNNKIPPIVDGANAGGWKATRTVGGEQYIIANAYESLKLAAQRPAAPLCGNRVWSQDGIVRAQRGSGSEQLFSTGGPVGFLNVFHDGRRIDWLDNDYETLHAAVFTGATWQEVDRAGLHDSAPGGTYRSTGTLENDSWYSASHDNDWLLRTQNFFNLAVTTVIVQTSSDNGGIWRDTVVFQKTGFNGTSTEYTHRRAVFAADGTTFLRWQNLDSVAAGESRTAHTQARYYPTTRKALLFTNVQQTTVTLLSEFSICPWASVVNGVNTEECRSWHHVNESYATDLEELSLQNGARETLLAIAGRQINAAGVSEAEDEIMLIQERRVSQFDRTPRTDGTPGFTFSNSQTSQTECQASWHSVNNLSSPRLQILSNDMCTSVSRDGGGTIAPVIGQHGTSPSLGIPGLTDSRH